MQSLILLGTIIANTVNAAWKRKRNLQKNIELERKLEEYRREKHIEARKKYKKIKVYTITVLIKNKKHKSYKYWKIRGIG